MELRTGRIAATIRANTLLDTAALKQELHSHIWSARALATYRARFGGCSRRRVPILSAPVM